MKKIFAIFAIAMMFMFTSCTCGRQTEKVVDETAIETVVETTDSTAVEVLDAADSTLSIVW